MAIAQLLFLAVWVVALIWILRFQSRQAARGSVEVARYLQTRGQELVSIKHQLLSWRRVFGRGLSRNAVTFEIVARSSDGELHMYHWAYDPFGFGEQNAGVKRFANGVWFDAA